MASLNYAGTDWDLYVGANKIVGVESVEPDMEQEQNDIPLINNTTLTVDGASRAAWDVTIVDLGQENLTNLIPSSVLAAGTQIEGQPVGTVVTTGGSVTTFGYKDCEAVEVNETVRLVPCGKVEHTEWLFDAKATLINKSIEDGVMKYTIRFNSQATGVQSAKGDITLPA